MQVMFDQILGELNSNSVDYRCHRYNLVGRGNLSEHFPESRAFELGIDDKMQENENENMQILIQ